MNYSLPINLAEITRGKRAVEEMEIRTSIHQNINVILRTFTLKYQFDPSFGCILNKYQAATPPQKIPERIWRSQMREDIQNNLKDMLIRYETRIQVKDVFVEMKKPKTREKTNVNVKVRITGNLSLGRKEQFHFPDSEVSEDALEILPLMIPIGN